MQMAKIKILKTGETNIESTDIWRFAIHSDHKNQKVTPIFASTFTLPAGSSWFNGDWVESTINHNIGRYLAYYAEVFYQGKSYPVISDASPKIPVTSADEFEAAATFRIFTDENNAYIQCWASELGETLNNNTFTLRIRFVLDDLI